MIASEDLFTDEFEEIENEDEGNALEAEEVPTTESNDNQDDENDKKIVKPKRIVRNPQPKLNADTLKGNRGLLALPSYFERVKYKGKGYEDQDLTVILKTYEYWCHRLFPKYPFEQCISKIEKLGSKRVVATHIKKIRLDMAQDDEAIINNVDSDVEEKVDEEFNSIFNDIPNMLTPLDITEEQQERMTLNREKAEKIRQGKLKKAQERSELVSEETASYLNENVSQVSINSFNEDTPHSPQSETVNINVQVELSEEQQEHIKLNKERAERVRQERLKKRKEIGQASTSNKLSTYNENYCQEHSQSSETLINSSCTEVYEDVDSIFNKIQDMATEESLDDTQ